MADRYQAIRKALAMGPTPGPFSVWRSHSPGNQELIIHISYKDEYGLPEHYCTVRSRLGGELGAEAKAALIAACDSDTIRALVDERDAQQAEIDRLRARVASLSQPAEAQTMPDWGAAPPGATHYQPHQDAYYKRVSATEWYVWSRYEKGERLRWLYAPGTSDSAEWVVRPTDAMPPPSAPVGVRCGECRGTGEVCTGTIDGTPELFDCDRCGGTGNSLALQPDAGVDVEAVLRRFLTGDGFIAECDIPDIVAALTAQPAISGYTCTVPDDCETLRWRGQILSMNELASVAQPAEGAEHATINLPPSSSMQPVATAFFTERGEVAFTGLFDRTLKALEAVKTTRMGISSGSIDLYAAPQLAVSPSLLSDIRELAAYAAGSKSPRLVRASRAVSAWLEGAQAAEPVKALRALPSGTNYSVEPHGNGYAIYRGRDRFHHGANLAHLTECTPEFSKRIESALNAMSEPVEVPSDAEIIALALSSGIRKSEEHWGDRYYTEVGSNLIGFARALLARYGAVDAAMKGA